MSEKVLSVNNLVINFKTDNGTVHAVRDVSFDLERGETLCIVGESGSGKSVTSKAIMGILANNAIIENGSIMYRGENLLEVSEDEFYKIRGHRIGMIFQDPLSSLNPIVKIGKQITEAMLINSNKLQTMYNDLISDALIAYKNTLAKMNIQINAEKKKLVLLDNDYKREVEVLENKIINTKYKVTKKEEELKTKLYELKYEFKEQQKQNKLDLNYQKDQANNDPQKLQELTTLFNQKSLDLQEKYNQDVALTKSKFEEEITQITQQVNEEVEKINQEINQATTKFKADLKALKAPLKDNIKKIKEEAIQKALPLKEKLEEVKKEARKKVNNYKNQVLSEHKTKMLELTNKLAAAQTDEEKGQIKKEITEEKTNCINKLKITKAEAKRRALEIMKEVGIPEPEKRFKQYPFEFSGGMRQRIVIAIALTETPEILICDEPTTALDVTIQAQILELINSIKKERNLSCIFITHDLGVVANMADRVAVMYAGKIVEQGTAEEIFFDPRHPYTWALLSSIPDVDSKERLDAIPGTPPNMIYPPKGDAFALRSKYAMKIDFEAEPPMFKITDTHYASTWLLDERAPKVEMPKIVSERIKNSLAEGKKHE